MPAALTRLRHAVREDGVAGVARRVAARGTHSIVLHEEHIWYSLDLTVGSPGTELEFAL